MVTCLLRDTGDVSTGQRGRKKAVFPHFCLGQPFKLHYKKQCDIPGKSPFRHLFTLYDLYGLGRLFNFSGPLFSTSIASKYSCLHLKPKVQLDVEYIKLQVQGLAHGRHSINGGH